MKNNYLKSILYSYGSVVITSLFGFITVPLSLNYFGKDLFGMFSIANDTLAYLALFNFGIPWATATIFAKLLSYHEQRKLILKAFILLLLLSAVMTMSTLVVNLLFPNWTNFISGLDLHTIEIAKLFIGISIAFYIIKLPFSLFSQLMIFINHVYIAKIIDVLSVLLSFIILLVVVYFKFNIVQYAIINGLVSLIPLLISVVIFFKIWKSLSQRSNDAPCNSEETVSYQQLISSSFYFFLNGIGGLILGNTDSFIIGHYLGIGAVAEYSVMFKFFMILFMIITQLMNVINPLYPKLLKENKREQLALLFNLTTKIFPIIGGFLFILLFGVFKDFVVLWIQNDKIFIGNASCFALSLYCYFICSSIVPYSALMSLNYSKEIYVLTLLEAMVNLCLSIYLVTKIGVAGVVFGTLIAHVLTIFILVPKKLNRLIPNLFEFNFSYVIKHVCFVIVPTSILIYLLNAYPLSWFKISALICIFLFYSFMSLVVLGTRDIKNIKYELMSKFMATKH